MLTAFRQLNENNLWIIEENGKNGTQAQAQNPTDIEKAIANTGYGLFNILMLLAALPIGWTCVLDTTVTTFFLQSSECDFELTLFRRGLAVGIVYIGMMIAGPLWDFIFQDYIIGYYGKRNVMIIGLLLDSICNVLWAHATSYYIFILFKFFNGILIAGPLSVLMPYLSEFHAPSYQSKFAKWSNLLFAISNIFPPAVASVLVWQTSGFKFHFLNRFYATWRVYMLICAIPPVLGAVTACFMPKSPKFLLTIGQNNEALRVLKTMYRMNNFESSSKYEIKKLISQQRNKIGMKTICSHKFQDSVMKLRILCSKLHLKTFLIILALQFTSMLGFNTMRLWVPQLFITLNNFSIFIRSYYPIDETITMCEMLFPRIQKIDYASCNYTLPNVESAVYVNSTIIASAAVFFSFLFTALADTRIKKITGIILSFLVSTIGSFCANWAVEIPYILVFCSLIIVTSRIAGNIIVTYSSETMPQSLRPAATSSINFIGNIGAAVGTIGFSVILGINCVAGIMGIGCFTLICYVLSFFIIRSPSQENRREIERF